MGGRREVLSALRVPLVGCQTCQVVVPTWTDRLGDALELGIAVHWTGTRFGKSIESTRLSARCGGQRTTTGLSARGWMVHARVVWWWWVGVDEGDGDCVA